jgi:uncharacterized protein DUF1326
MTPWQIEDRELINCNCAYGSPCQFNAVPTKGYCEAMGAIGIEKGHYGDVPLDGVNIGIFTGRVRSTRARASVSRSWVSGPARNSAKRCPGRSRAEADCSRVKPVD